MKQSPNPVAIGNSPFLPLSLFIPKQIQQNQEGGIFQMSFIKRIRVEDSVLLHNVPLGFINQAWTHADSGGGGVGVGCCKEDPVEGSQIL